MNKELETILSDIDKLTLDENNQYHELKKILDRILSALNCDRIWCLYPCDPKSKKWSIPIEITKPEWGGVHKSGLNMPMTDSDADVINNYLKADGPITYGKNADHPLPENLEKIFLIKSQIATAVYPKQSKAWLLGVHYCEKSHVFTSDEIQYFDNLGKKLGETFGNSRMFEQS